MDLQEPCLGDAARQFWESKEISGVAPGADVDLKKQDDVRRSFLLCAMTEEVAVDKLAK